MPHEGVVAMMSNGGGWWLLGIPLMIICMVMMARMMSHGHGAGSHTNASSADGHPDARRVLADRLARGEIDIEEYESRLAALEPGSTQNRS